MPPPIPDFYEPVFTGMATLAFSLRGFERLATQDLGVVQRWHCELP